MPLDPNLHQTATHLGCVGFSMYASGFSVPQMRQFCLFTYPPRSKWASSEKVILFAEIGIFCKSIAGPLTSVVQAYTQPYSVGRRIKLIICQIRHLLSVTIYEKKTLDSGPYICMISLAIYKSALSLHIFQLNFVNYLYPFNSFWSKNSKYWCVL